VAFGNPGCGASPPQWRQTPHFLVRERREDGTYVRVGSTNRKADLPMIEPMRRFAASGSYDEQAMPDLDSEGADFRVASEPFERVRPLKRRDLESLRLVTVHQGKMVPAIGGILLLGVNHERRFPDAWIQAGRFDGLGNSMILGWRRSMGRTRLQRQSV